MENDFSDKLADAISSGGDPGGRFRPHLRSQCFDHHLQLMNKGHPLNLFVCLFDFDSLIPINNLSVKQRRVFLG